MIYVMSDIHGNMHHFRSVMDQIKLQPEDTLYVLGDIMDRYPDGVAILQELMAMPNAKLLLGNHEYMLLQSMDRATNRSLDEDEQVRSLPRWQRNGGDLTKKALDALDKKEKQRIIRFIKKLPLFYELEVNGKHYRLIHAAPLELFPAHEQSYHNSTEYAVWHRWELEEPLPFETDTVFIFGHTPTMYFAKETDPMQIFVWKNRIGIDCGSGFPPTTKWRDLPGGRLACLRLDDMKEFYSEEESIEEWLARNYKEAKLKWQQP